MILYHKTENLIGRVNTNVFSGYAQITGNLGDMVVNKGWSTELNTRNLISTNLDWSTLFTLSLHNNNKIPSLNLAAPITPQR